MKKILYLLVSLIPIFSYAQNYKNIGNTNETVRAKGGLEVDSNLQIPTRDTTYHPLKAGSFVFRNGQWYGWDGVYWRRISTDTIGVAVQVPSDWNATSGVSQILNKPSLAAVATSGSYSDLIDKPSIPAAQVSSDWTAVSGISIILNKPSLSAVATSGSYLDLSNTPRKVDTIYKTGSSSFAYKINGSSYSISLSGGGGAAGAYNVGSQYRLVLTDSSGIKTIGQRWGLVLDTLTSNSLFFTIDTSLVASKYYVSSQGFLTANQTVTLSGAVTGSGNTAITTTISNSAVTYAKIQNETSSTLLGRLISGSGPPGEITFGLGITSAGTELISDTSFLSTHTWSLSQGFLTGANNGVSLNGLSVLLGQSVSQSGSPGKFTSSRELDLNSNKLFIDSGVVVINKATTSDNSTNFQVYGNQLISTNVTNPLTISGSSSGIFNTTLQNTNTGGSAQAGFYAQNNSTESVGMYVGSTNNPSSFTRMGIFRSTGLNGLDIQSDTGKIVFSVGSNQNVLGYADSKTNRWIFYNGSISSLPTDQIKFFQVNGTSYFSDTAFLKKNIAGTTNDSLLTKDISTGAVHYVAASRYSVSTFSNDAGYITTAALANRGSGYTLYAPQLSGMRTIYCAGCIIDSTTHAGSLTFTVSGSAADSGTFATHHYIDSLITADSVHFHLLDGLYAFNDTTFGVAPGFLDSTRNDLYNHGSGINIYLADGTLSGNRKLSGSSTHTLLLDSLKNFTVNIKNILGSLFLSDSLMEIQSGPYNSIVGQYSAGDWNMELSSNRITVAGNNYVNIGNATAQLTFNTDNSVTFAGDSKFLISSLENTTSVDTTAYQPTIWNNSTGEVYKTSWYRLATMINQTGVISGGGGTSITNIGSYYRLWSPQVPGLRTIRTNSAGTVDSTSATNALTINIQNLSNTDMTSTTARNFFMSHLAFNMQQVSAFQLNGYSNLFPTGGDYENFFNGNTDTVRGSQQNNLIIGDYNVSTGNNNIISGRGLIAKGNYQALFGQYNDTTNQGKMVWAVGWGSGYNVRKSLAKLDSVGVFYLPQMTAVSFDTASHKPVTINTTTGALEELPSWPSGGLDSSFVSDWGLSISRGSNYVKANVDSTKLIPWSDTTGHGTNTIVTLNYFNTHNTGLSIGGNSQDVIVKSGTSLYGNDNFIWDTTNLYLKITKTALGATPSITSGAYFLNSTAAVLGTTQVSPSVTLEGQGWGTTGGTSQSVKVRSYLNPIQGTVPAAEWRLGYSINGGNFVDMLRVNSGNKIYLGPDSATNFSYIYNDPTNNKTAYIEGLKDIGGNGAIILGNNNGAQVTINYTGMQTPGLLGVGATPGNNSLYITGSSGRNGINYVNTAYGGTFTVSLAPGLILNNTLLATSGNQQISPPFQMAGEGYKTNAPAGSQAVSFFQYVLPIQGTVSPTGEWRLASSIAGATAVQDLAVDIVGDVAIGGLSTDTLSFLKVPAGTTLKSQINLAPGLAPTSPRDGDLFYDTTGSVRHLYTRIGSVSQQLDNQASGGTFTSTFTNTTNITSSSFSQGTYTQVGNIVTVSISGTFTPTAGSATVLTVSLPVSTATTTQNYIGTGTCQQTSSWIPGMVSIVSGTTATFSVDGTSSGSPLAFNMTFQYKIN